MLATNPETFEILEKNNIDLFHGTNANALPTILKYGLNSLAELSEKGIPVLTGEEWSRVAGAERRFISFADSLTTATDYAISKDSSEMSFGVILGISSDNLEQLKTCMVQSSIPEIGI